MLIKSGDSKGNLNDYYWNQSRTSKLFSKRWNLCEVQYIGFCNFDTFGICNLGYCGHRLECKFIIIVLSPVIENYFVPQPMTFTRRYLDI